MQNKEFRKWLFDKCTGGQSDGTNQEVILKVTIYDIIDAANRFQPLLCRYPWIFWFTIKLRPKWFSYWWKTRGANFLEIQFFIFCISIGRPWKKSYLEGHLRDYATLNGIKNTNDELSKKWNTIQIGRYNNAP